MKKSKFFQNLGFWMSRISMLIIFAFLGVIIFHIVQNGIGVISWEFLTQPPTNAMTEGGILPALVGTVYLVALVIAETLPVGILTAIYIVEYSPKESKLTGWITQAVYNLRGVPSIVIGLFGLTLFVKLLGFGGSLLSASLSLSLIALPTVIVSSIEALKSVPDSFRKASTALGATKWGNNNKSYPSFCFSRNNYWFNTWGWNPLLPSSHFMSAAMIILNIIVISAGGSDGVAVFTSGWRIIMLGIIPLTGMAAGVTAVTGAAYGAKNKEKLKTAYNYAIKIGILIEAAVVTILVFLFAPQIAQIFTYSADSSRIFGDLVNFLRITALMFPSVPLGMFTAAMFRGIGKGKRSLIATVLRTIIFQVPVAYILGIEMNMGLIGIWAGIVIGDTLAGIVGILWGRMTINNIPLYTAGIENIYPENKLPE